MTRSEEEMDIRILPGNIANMIAAGEVVQRPASVVKELMENAVDAGADTVTVVVQDAGRTLIQVMDNGCGMSPDEAVLCFERHATSKIATAEDLSAIQTFGFRGEALASIAAVSEVTLRTRREEDEVGCEVLFADSRHLSTQEVSAPRGANFAVRNLFYNVPARRKFIKSDNVEMKHIVSEFLRIALTRPELNFTLTSNGREVYVLKKANSLKFRIQDLLGGSVVNTLVDVSAETSVAGIKGYIGSPDSARKNQGNQYFFVNGRYFRSPYLHKAVMKAYDKLIPDGTYPSYNIFFTVPPEDVDVNIHPAKTEVKFENETELFEILTAVVKESLGRTSFIPTLDFDHDAIPDIQAPSLYAYTGPSQRHSRAKGGYSTLFTESAGHVTAPYVSSPSEPVSPVSFESGSAVDGYGEIFQDSGVSAGNILQVSGRYVVTTLRSGLMVIDVRRARERIFYERYLRQLLSLLTEDQDRLRRLGFDIEQTGDGEVSVKGLPDGLGTDEASVRTAVDGLLAAFMENDSIDVMKAGGRDALARRLAVSAASSCQSGRLSADEARLLVDTLFSCAEPEISPAGLRCMLVLTEEDIERQL